MINGGSSSDGGGTKNRSESKIATTTTTTTAPKCDHPTAAPAKDVASAESSGSNNKGSDENDESIANKTEVAKAATEPEEVVNNS